MAFKIVILAGKNQSPEQLEKIQIKFEKLGFRMHEDILLIISKEHGVARILENVEIFKENTSDDTLFITLANLDTRDGNLVEGITVEKYFDSLAKKTGKKIKGVITSVESGSTLIAHGIDGLNSDGITLNQNTDFIIEMLGQIKKGHDTYKAFSTAHEADRSAPAPERKEEKKERKVEVSNYEDIPSSKTKVDKSDKFELQIYKAAPNKEAKAPPNKEAKEEKKSSPSLSAPPKLYKAVILIGTNHTKEHIEDLSALLRKQGVLDEEILILGDGKKMMSDVVKEVSKYKDHFTDDTVYMSWVHGGDTPQGHVIDSISTSEFHRILKEQTGKPKIKTVLTSCYGSKFIKRNEIPDGVSTLTRRGSSRTSMIQENYPFIANLATFIIKSKTIEEAYAKAIQDEVGSFYFVPLSDQALEDKKEEKDKSSLTEKEKLATAREARGIKKINRVGKFSRKFLMEFAKELGEAGEDLIREIEKEEYRHKTHFGLDKIKSIMGIVTKREDSKEGGAEETITPPKYANFLLKLREKLQKQVTEKNIAKFLKERSKEFFGTSKSESSKKSLMLDYLMMVSEYGLEEEVMAVLKNNPKLINMSNGISTPLISAAYRDKTNIINLLLNLGATIDNYVPINHAARLGRLASVKLLLEKGAKVNTITLDSNQAFIESSASGNVEIAKLLAQKQPPSRSDLEASLEIAIEKGYSDFVIYCLSFLPSQYKDKNGHDILQMAAVRGQVSFIEKYMALAAKEKGEEYDKNQQKELLIFASRKCSKENFKKLLPLIKPNIALEVAKEDANFLTFLAQINDIKVIKFLLKKGIDFDIVNKDKQNAMMVAAAYGNTELTELLINQGKSPEEINNRRRIALLFACAHGKIETVKALTVRMTVEQIDELNDSGKNAADIAARFGHLDILNFLISTKTPAGLVRSKKILAAFSDYKKGQNNSMQQLGKDHGWTIILTSTTIYNRPDILEAIFNSTPGLKDPKNIFRLLVIAIKNDSPLSANLLINMLGKDGIKTTDQLGNTALHLCIIEGKLEIAKLLLAKKVDLTLVNKEGKSALDLALGNGQYQFVLEILKTGKCDWRKFCSVMPTVEKPTTPESSVAFKKLLEIRKDADALNEILGKGKLVSKKLSTVDLDKIFAIMARNKDHIDILDTIGRPKENESILSRCLKHCKDKNVIQKLSDNLDLFITPKNLFGGSNDSIPVRIAIKRAFEEPIFHEIVGKLAARMESAESSFKFDLEFQTKDIRTGWRGNKSTMGKMEDAIKKFSEIAEGDFKSGKKQSESATEAKVRKKSVKVTTIVQLKKSKTSQITP